MVKRIALAAAVFGAWFLAGGFVWAILYESISLAMLGGNYTPPLAWRLSRDFGIFVLPFIMTFGGVPTAIQIARGKPAGPIFVFTAAACIALWGATWFMVFAAPDVFGWWW